MPTVADQVAWARSSNSTGHMGNTSLSGSASTILGLTTLFYALSVGATGIAVAVVALRQAGILTT